MTKGRVQRTIVAWIMILAVLMQPALAVNAMTVYESDGICHEEGYIIIGESHSALAAGAVAIKARTVGNVLHWGDGIDISYEQRWDSSIAVTQDGDANTFTMKGNLFFVFEGIEEGVDDKLQTSREYIYSDGTGNRGRAVQKIHEIMETNPNVAHWNIISMHGAVSASKGTKEIADYYVNSYRNWIEYEFPDADCYFLSIATMTKYYRATRDKNIFNNTLKAAFPDKFLDYTDFYAARSPQRMIDTIHWDEATYVDLISDVVRTAGQKSGIQVQDAVTPESYTVTEVQAVLYTNDLTVVYSEPSLGSSVMLPSCEAGIPVQVTGITDNGFFRISISSDGTQFYVPGYGLS